MSKKIPPPAAPLPDPQPATGALAHVGDPYWGQGGRYVVDPATGRRQPAPETPTPPAPKE